MNAISQLEKIVLPSPQQVDIRSGKPDRFLVSNRAKAVMKCDIL
jgi:hypothetical protein